METHYNLDLIEDQIVFFADIIGFKNLVAKNQNISLEDQTLDGIIVNLQTIFWFFRNSDFSPGNPQVGGLKYLHFSDSIAMSCHKNNISILMDAINNLYNQLYAADLIFRGGISIGKLHHSEHAIWGPALNEAVDLEGKIASSPRINATEEVSALLKTSGDVHSRYFKEESTATEYGNIFYYDHFSFCLNQSFDHAVFIHKSYSLIENGFLKAERHEEKAKWQWLSMELTKAINSNFDAIDKNLSNYKQDIGTDADRLENFKIFSSSEEILNSLAIINNFTH